MRITLVLAACILGGLAAARGDGAITFSGQVLTPTAAAGASFAPLNPGLRQFP